MTKFNTSSVLMTDGPIINHILKFSLPLMIGYLFQQLYTTVDSIVVGNVVGKEALAAVGSTTPIVNMIILFFTGLSSGACVIISKYFGANDCEKVQKSVNTSFTLFSFLSIVATFIGVWIVPSMLKFMDTPSEVFEDAKVYLTIYYWGTAALVMYNLGSAILRSVGDSKRPLFFLIVSSFVNVIFDIIFVVYFNMGVAGAAYATVLSEIISAILSIISLCCTKDIYKLNIRKLTIDYEILKEMMKIGLPSAIQQSLTSFSNIFVQSYINFFGSIVMAGWACYTKLDQFIVIPVNSISMAITTFVGQNLGAGKIKRVKKGVKQSLIIALIFTAILIMLACIFSNSLASMFNDDLEVIEIGSYFLRLILPFYLAWCITMILAGALCGAGDTRMATFSKFFSFVIFRQIYLYFITQKFNSIQTVVLGYPAGWVLSAILIFLYYHYKNEEIILKFSKEDVIDI